MNLVERLRAPMSREQFFAQADSLCHEAAAEIERLQKEIETAREALEPFANRAGKLDGLWGENDTNWSPAYGATAITVGDLRRASAAYRALKDKEVAGC